MKQKTAKPEPRGKTAGDDVARFFTHQFVTVFSKPCDTLPSAELLQLQALALYFAYRHNGYVLAEALNLCTRNRTNPPAWVIESLNAGLQKFLNGRSTIRRALALSGRDREEYDQYRSQHEVMGAVRDRIDRDPKRKIATACNNIAGKHGWTPSAAEKAYRKFWKGFFEYVATNQQT